MKSVFTDVSKMNDYINFKLEKEKNILMIKYPKNSISLFLKLAFDRMVKSAEFSIFPIVIVFFVLTIVGAILLPINEVKYPLIFCAFMLFIYFIFTFIELLLIDYNAFIKNIVIDKMSRELVTIEDLKDIKYYLSKEILDFFMKDMASGKIIYWDALLTLHKEEMEEFIKKDKLKNIQEQVL